MSIFYSFTQVSENSKTGPIPTITISKNSCPNSCPLIGKCYPNFGSQNIHWTKVSNGLRGGNINELCKKISLLPNGQLYRYGVAGEIPGNGENINLKDLNKLIEANKGKKGFLYTHKYFLKSNHKKIKAANDQGFTINLSANNLKHADKLAKLEIGPIAAVVPENTPNTFYTPAGRKGIVCPAQQRKDITCQKCKLCQVRDRSVIIGFRVHGSNKKKIEEISANFKV